MPSPWPLLPLGLTFTWTLPGATEHLAPQCQTFWEQGLGCQELEALRRRRLWVMILGKAGLWRSFSLDCDTLPHGEKDARGGRELDPRTVLHAAMARVTAHDMPQLPQYKDKSTKSPFVCCFVTASQFGFSWCLPGECPHPIIISWH